MNTFFRTIPQLAYLLSNKGVFSMVWICMCLWYVLMYEWLLGTHTSVRVRLVYAGCAFTFIFTSLSDVAVFKEVFLNKEYAWVLEKEPAIILDLGAHTGNTAIYYHTQYPKATIYAVEPDPTLFLRLQENTKDIKSIVPVHMAVSHSTGSALLHVSSLSSLRGSLVSRKLDDVAVEVPTSTLTDLFKTYGLTRADLIKFDIEGAEQFLFAERGAVSYADAYIGEFHADLTGLSPEVFLKSFEGMEVTMQPMERNSRFSLKAKIK